MQAINYTIKLSPPSAVQLAHLRSAVGWDNPELSVLEHSINQSLFWVSAHTSEQLIGVGRIVGDGAMYFYIQDLIVLPPFQGQKVATGLMEHIEHYLLKTCSKRATVGLFAAKGKESFYRKYAYLERNGEHLGFAMCKFI